MVGYLIALVSKRNPYTISCLLFAWVFLAGSFSPSTCRKQYQLILLIPGYVRSDKKWGSAGLVAIIAVSSRILFSLKSKLWCLILLSHTHTPQTPLIIFTSSVGYMGMTLEIVLLSRIRSTFLGVLVILSLSFVWPIRAAVLLRNKAISNTVQVLSHFATFRHAS